MVPLRGYRVSLGGAPGQNTVIAALSMPITAVLFGGMTLFSFGFAPFLFSSLAPEIAATTIRKAFPIFYPFVAVTATVLAQMVYS